MNNEIDVYLWECRTLEYQCMHCNAKWLAKSENCITCEYRIWLYIIPSQIQSIPGPGNWFSFMNLPQPVCTIPNDLCNFKWTFPVRLQFYLWSRDSMKNPITHNKWTWFHFLSIEIVNLLLVRSQFEVGYLPSLLSQIQVQEQLVLVNLWPVHNVRMQGG